MDRDCLKWERFSSEGHLDPGGSSSLATEKIDGATQTSDLEPSPGPQIIIPDINDDSAWGVGEDDDHGNHDDHDGGNDDDDNFGGNINLAGNSNSKGVELIVPDRPYVQGPSISDLMPAEASHLFTKAPLNFDEKIFCSVDPDNCKRFFYDQYNLGVHIRSFHEGKIKIIKL